MLLISFLWVCGYLFILGSMTQAEIYPKTVIGVIAFCLVGVFMWPFMLGKLWIVKNWKTTN